ncbi:MAG TPA: exosortase U, partial [Pirellulales bacterium]|nr:exosortase U [Pirellulales bacterium]
AAPLLWVHAREMMASDQYNFFILVPFGGAILAWQRTTGLGTMKPGATGVFSLLMGLSAATLALAVAVFSPWFAMVATLVAVLGLTYGIGGARMLARMFPPWLFLCFMIPLPFEWDDALVASLQRLTAIWSSRLLDSIGILHLMTGNTVELPGKQLFVEEACSGVQSLFACMAATMFFVVWSRYRLVRSLLLLASALGWVLVANATRVVLITWLTMLGFDVVDGLPHTVLGMGVFAVTLALMFSTDRLFEFFLSHRYTFWRRREREREATQITVFPPLPTTRLGSWVALPIAVCFGLILLTELALLVPTGAAAEADLSEGPPAVFDEVTRESLPTVWRTRPLTAYGTDVERVFKSVHSRYWAYGAGRNRMYASVDYPFSKWHDLSNCYRALGWKLDTKIFNPPLEPGDLPLYEVELDQEPLGYGYVVFFLFDRNGEPMPIAHSGNPVRRLGERAAQRASHIRENWQAGGRQIAGEDLTKYIQLQVFISSMTPIKDADRADARLLFKELYNQVLGSARQPAEAASLPSE